MAATCVRNSSMVMARLNGNYRQFPMYSHILVGPKLKNLARNIHGQKDTWKRPPAALILITRIGIALLADDRQQVLVS
jgi:hypothetical protein